MPHGGPWPDGLPVPPDDPNMALHADGWKLPAAGGGGGANRTDLIFLDAGSVQVCTNAATTGTEFTSPRYRIPIDLASSTEVRGIAVVTTAGLATSLVRWQFSADNGGTWQSLIGTLSQTEVGIGSTGVKVSPWGTLVSAAKADVLVRWVCIGDGVVDPAVCGVRLQFR